MITKMPAILRLNATCLPKQLVAFFPDIHLGVGPVSKMASIPRRTAGQISSLKTSLIEEEEMQKSLYQSVRSHKDKHVRNLPTRPLQDALIENTPEGLGAGLSTVRVRSDLCGPHVPSTGRIQILPSPSRCGVKPNNAMMQRLVQLGLT